MWAWYVDIQKIILGVCSGPSMNPDSEHGHYWHQTRQEYSAARSTMAMASVHSVDAEAPQLVPANQCSKLFLVTMV